MALTKVQKTGITDNAIDADKIEDGTIVAADIANGAITNDKLAGSIANDKLANSSITVNGSSVSLGGSVSAGKVQWQSVITADGSTTTSAVAGEGYFIDTTSNAHTITLPGSPSIGDTIAIKDYAGTFGTNALTIGRNGNNIQGVANNSQIGTNRASVVLVYIDGTKGWLYTNESNVADLQEALFVTATGGTITTSGDFKIHSFTGDGCFVVSQVGNPSGGPSNVDYLVVAGGGGGGQSCGGGGGGAGGYRTTFPSPGCNAGSFPITAQTYPITVGGGGVADTTSGSPSTFSTITSSGGGKGGGGTGTAGGSGGGGGNANPGGAGNTPPVSPSQGNNGGLGVQPGSAFAEGGGGGGGANAAGQNGFTNNGGIGGAGKANSITGSPVTYAGGGGGGTGGPGTNGVGGAGGGGNGGVTGGAPTSYPRASTAGTPNTGGGGGGSGTGGGDTPVAARNGGSGIVIIRYKFQ